MSKRKALRFTITCSGETDDDFDDALEGAMARIKMMNTSGNKRWDTGAFYFTVTEVPEGEEPS